MIEIYPPHSILIKEEIWTKALTIMHNDDIGLGFWIAELITKEVERRFQND